MVTSLSSTTGGGKLSPSKSFKIVLLGDASVGKTHLCSRFITGTLPLNAQATVGIEFQTKDMEVAPGEYVRAHIWDTAGQERFRSITTTHYRRAHGALVVYDITRRRSFEHTSSWIEELRGAAEVDVCICLVGNKVDLENQREVSTDEAKRFAESNSVLFFETSTCSGLNVVEAFTSTIRKVYQNSIQNNLDQQTSPNWPATATRTEKRQYIKDYNQQHKGGLKLTNKTQQQKQSNCCGDDDDDDDE